MLIIVFEAIQVELKETKSLIGNPVKTQIFSLFFYLVGFITFSMSQEILLPQNDSYGNCHVSYGSLKPCFSSQKHGFIGLHVSGLLSGYDNLINPRYTKYYGSICETSKLVDISDSQPCLHTVLKKLPTRHSPNLAHMRK